VSPREGGGGRPSGDLRLDRVTKRFGQHLVVDDLELTVPQGSFFALLGPSGCGKTTTLRMVSGLEEPTAGRVLLGGTDVTTSPPYKRPVNTVFQNYALFPHLDVFDNVAFGLRRRRVREVKQLVDDVLDLVQLPDLARRKPAQLSGGQQQRVALARALVNRPQVLLLDEPLGALDLKLRRQMQLELKRIQTDVGLTFVHVTHDQEEAMTMADTIAVMNAGRIEQQGAPAELYDYPATSFVANFLGQSNLLPGTVTGRSGADLLVDVHGQRVVVPAARSRAGGDGVLVGVRPEKVRLIDASATVDPGVSRLSGAVVTDTSFAGVSTQYVLRLPWGQEATVFEQNTGITMAYAPGATLDLCWESAHGFALDGAQDVHAGAVDVVAGADAVAVG
jgi:spermidine/putrescine transport system ATP-binding protein